MRGVIRFLVVLLALAGVIAWSPQAAAVPWTEGSSSYSSSSLGGQTLTLTGYSGSGGYSTTSTQWQNTDLIQYTSSLKHKSAANLAFQLPTGQNWDAKKIGWAYEAIYSGAGNGASALSVATASTGGSKSPTGALDADFHFKVGLPGGITPSQAPIPGTLALFGFGLAVLLGAAFRRRVAKGQP